MIGQKAKRLGEDILYRNLLGNLPKKWVSHQVGQLAHSPLPRAVHQQLIAWYVRSYQINIDELKKPLEDFQSLGEFFSRELRPESRPIESETIHPCDGVLLEAGQIHDGTLIQAKGKTYQLDELTPENPWLQDFQGGSYYTYYLSPKDYHRVHMPMSGDVQWCSHIPGELWPVNSWSVRNQDALYSQNERLVMGIQAPQGKAIVVMVGATNVGSISVPFDPNIKTNDRSKNQTVHRSYKEGRAIGVGEELGCFHLGSSVVFLLVKTWDFEHHGRKSVKMGQSFSS